MKNIPSIGFLLVSFALMYGVYFSGQIYITSAFFESHSCCSGAICCCLSAGKTVCNCEISDIEEKNILVCGISDAPTSSESPVTFSSVSIEIKAVFCSKSGFIFPESRTFFGTFAHLYSDVFGAGIWRPPIG